MKARRQSRVGMLAIGVLVAVGYIRQRESDSPLLASIVGGSPSAVSYALSGQMMTVYGRSGGSDALDLVMMYDAEKVQLQSVQSSYTHRENDDKTSLVHIQLTNLPKVRNQTPLVVVQRSGSVDSVVVSDAVFPSDPNAGLSISAE